MIQIIRLTYNDDKDASTNIDVMACSSKDCAKEIILNEINDEFDGKWKSLKDAAAELNNDLEHGHWDEDNTFSWFDNGKGETYIVGSVETHDLNRGFTHFGEI